MAGWAAVVAESASLERVNELLDALDGVGRLGWVDAPSPVHRLEGLVQELGVSELWIKTDGALPALLGGSKVRKLDFLLAAEPWRDAESWTSVGATGSGHLVTLVAAGQRLGRSVHAHCFWEQPSTGVMTNLGAIIDGAAAVTAYRGRWSLALAAPATLMGTKWRGMAVIPPGATTPLSTLGMVRAGVELAGQVGAGELPAPDAVVVALGTGGTAVGLQVGLALAGMRAQVIAVATVEHLVATRRRLERLAADTIALLRSHGLVRDELHPRPLTIVRDQLGPGYGWPTEASLAACRTLSDHGHRIEPVYTGKAIAAVMAGAVPSGLATVLFWNTMRGRDPDPDSGWLTQCPPLFAKRLVRLGLIDEEGRVGMIPMTDPAPSPRLSRRTLLIGGLASLVTAAGWRFGFRPAFTKAGGLPWTGKVLNPAEAHILDQAARTLLAPWSHPEVLDEIPTRVDAYVATLPKATQREVRALLGLVEQGPLVLAGMMRRFTRMDDEARARYMERFAKKTGLLGVAFRGMRDLVMLAAYQHPATWPDIGYEGPWRADGDGGFVEAHDYLAMRATVGSLPKGYTQDGGNGQ